MKIFNRNLVICIVTLLLGILPFTGFSAEKNDGSRYAANSKLSTGKWVKIKLPETDTYTADGIYKLTYDKIKQMGIDDPSKVNIYGYGAWMLDENFTQPYVDDLPEVSVWINKGSDGVFNSGDYLLFYGRGTRKWTYESSTDSYVHENNPYATGSYYFLTQGDRGPKEMSSIESVSGAQSTLNFFDDYYVHEKDLVQAPKANSGRELFGESFSGNNAQTFSVGKIAGITADKGTVSLSFAAAASAQTPISLSIDGTEMISGNMPITSGQYYKGMLFSSTRTWLGEKSESPVVKITYNAGSQTFARLNYFRLNMERELKYYGDNYLFFRNRSSRSKAVNYAINNATNNLLVFDITDNFDAKEVKTAFNNGQLTFGVAANSALEQYVLVDPSKTFPEPLTIGVIDNQDLHGLAQTDMVIIAPQIFLTQAKILAEEHNTRSGLRVHVIQSDCIYNEFSSGTPDVTAYRRLMKMFYDRAETESDKPKYLLMFGDGIFDNRFLISDVSSLNKANFLLTYQFKESLNETESYGTHDYLGMLDDNTGTNLAGDKLDLGIGCFPVRTVQEAENAVSKVIAYMNDTQSGKWKNTVCFSADDSDTNTGANKRDFCSHANEADQSASYMEENHPEYMISKVYMDAYKQSIVNGKVGYPDANKKLNDVFKNGCFMYNYTGHGSVTNLSAEGMISINDVNQMTFTNLPLWITATCDFGWYDGTATSGGEAVFLNKKSAGIALFTTSRVVYSNGNLRINKQLVRNLFTKQNGEYLRLGDILRESKNALGYETNKLNYILMGDPALRLNYPDYSVELQTINGKALDGEAIPLKALQQVTMTGVVKDPLGSIASNFNGVLQTTTFDSKQTVSSVIDTSGVHFTFDDYPNTIFLGNDSVKNGKFSVTFMVPLDILYSDDYGKMNFYASDKTNGIDAKGAFKNYTLGGTDENAPDDEKGPEILSMYLNSSNFKSGDVVNSTPYFVAEVSDPNGINMSGSSLGHDIVISIDNNPTWTYNLNSYYQPSSGVYGEGIVKYSIPTLPEGEHYLVFRVWDLLNNPSTDSLRFVVDAGQKPQIFDLTATNTPAKVSTSFLLSHDRPDTEIEVEINVYDSFGRQVWKHKESGSTDWLESYPVEWDLHSGNGRVAPGVYIYQAIIKCQGSKEATEAKKMIVLDR